MGWFGPVTASSADNEPVGQLLLRSGIVETTPQSNVLAAKNVSEKFSADQRYILQTDGPLKQDDFLALVKTGVELLAYMPENAYLVDLSKADRNSLSNSGIAHWVGKYETNWKIDPAIGNRLGPFQSEYRKDLENQGLLKAVVYTFPNASLGTVETELTDLGATIIGDHMSGEFGAIDLIISKSNVEQLAEISSVMFIEEAPEITFRNSTNRWIVQSNMLDSTPLYDNGLTGTGQIVGIMDGEVNKDHCAVSDTNPIGATHRKIEAYNTSFGYNSHGTHVAGTVVGDGGAWDDNRGVAYDGRLVYNDSPSYPYGETDMVDHLTLHHNQGARVHTNSWGDDYTTDYNGLARAIDVFSHDYEESLVLFAVTNGSYLKNPENAKNVLAVGASEDTPSQDYHCSGGMGPTADGRRKPEIFAPGCSTHSATGSGVSCSTTTMTGTSMACPAVAGTAMLVRQYFTDGYYPTGAPVYANRFTPSGALVKATLLNSAVDMTGISGYPSNQEGWGRVLADNALFFPGDQRTMIVSDTRNANGLNTNDEIIHDFTVTGSDEQLRVTMVFTDVPGVVSASDPVVNNLDLEVVAPDGTTVYKGNVFSGGESTTGGSADAKNNVEQVHISDPTAGAYSAKIKGTAVNSGNQGYALVITGQVSIGPAPPETEDMEISTPTNMGMGITLAGSDIDDDPLDFIIMTLPSHGVLNDPEAGIINTVPYVVAAKGNVVNYTPNTGYAGNDGFVFKANDGGTPPDGGDSNTSYVHITVVATSPVIVTDSLPVGKLGEEYSQVQFAAVGGQPELVWSVIADGEYAETSDGVNGYAAVGAAQGRTGDTGFVFYNLPFSFPFYGSEYNLIRIRYDGFIDFGTFSGLPYVNGIENLRANRIIAPLWDDLILGSEKDIYIDSSTAGEVTVRWAVSTHPAGDNVEFSVTLRNSGVIKFHYGPGNNPVNATIGVSSGDGTNYTVSMYSGASSLNEVDSVTIAPPDLLPTGLVFNSQGLLSGTPTEAGWFEPAYKVTDDLGRVDLQMVPLFIADTYSADFDLDGDVDLFDFGQLQACWDEVVLSSHCATADLNDDGVLDLADFGAFVELMSSPN